MTSVRKEEAFKMNGVIKMAPTLSVVVPIYNVEKYLKQCLNSLVNQTLSNIEIILVNDGSTDNSEAICQFYAEQDSRIKLFSKPNGGLSDARNFGLQKVTSPVVGFVDSDDYVDLDMFQVLMELKLRSNAEIAVGGVKMVSNDGEEYLVRAVEGEIIADRHDAMEELLKSKRITNSVCNKIFDITLFDQISFPVGKLYEDEYVTYKLFDRANKVAMTNEVSYYYRSSPNSITHKPFSEREFDRIDASVIKVGYIDTKYPDLVQYAKRYLVYDCVMALSKMKKYKSTYDQITRDNIRKYLDCFMRGDYSKGTKLFALIAAVSPALAVRLYRTVTR